MNVLIDATWIASHYKKNSMHGGLRVVKELIKGIENQNGIELFYSVGYYDKLLIRNLEEYLIENKIFNLSERIVNNKGFLFDLKRVSFKIFNKNNEISNFNQNKLKNITVYHSPIGPIPDNILKNDRIKKIFTSHDLMPFVRPDLAPVEFYDFLKSAYDTVTNETKVICVSNYTKSELLNYRKDLDEKNIFVNYLGADKNLFFQNKNFEFIKKIKLKYQINCSNYILCLNRIQKYKNTEHILKAYDNILKSNKKIDLGIVLIGTFQNMKIKTQILERYNNKDIIFIEYVPDEELSILYSNALCFVYMSLYEGFGLPLLEAMQCGVPVISSNLTSLPEVVGDAGVCINPFDVDLLSNTILELYNSESKQKELSEKSLK